MWTHTEIEEALLTLEGQLAFSDVIRGAETWAHRIKQSLIEQAAEPWAPALYERFKVVAMELNTRFAGDCIINIPDALPTA